MNPVNATCAGCACLCDDIQVELKNDQITKVENACAKGNALFRSCNNHSRRNNYLVGNKEVSLERAVQEASYLLQKAKNPIIFGADNSTLETQALGIELGQAIQAIIDDASSFCQGSLIQGLFDGDIPSCGLADALTADLLIYWGSNPYHSHPRHLSKFSYYPRDDYKEVGATPDVTLSCVEVRDTEVYQTSNPKFKIRPGGDKEFIQGILTELGGETASEEARSFTQLMSKSRSCVIFAGLGLTYSLDGDFSLLEEMMTAFADQVQIRVIPMVGHFNMRGFNRSLYQLTGYVNKVKLINSPSHDQRLSFIEQVKKQTVDCALIIGADPLSNLPWSVMKNLKDIPMICLDPFITATSTIAQVVFGTAISGVEARGKAVRMDGEELNLLRVKQSEHATDEEIIGRLLSEVKR